MHCTGDRRALSSETKKRADRETSRDAETAVEPPLVQEKLPHARVNSDCKMAIRECIQGKA